MIQPRDLQSEFLSHLDFFTKIIVQNERKLITQRNICESFKSKRIMIIGAGETTGSAVARRFADSALKAGLQLERVNSVKSVEKSKFNKEPCKSLMKF